MTKSSFKPVSDHCILVLHFGGARILNVVRTFELIPKWQNINKIKQFSVVPVGRLDKSKPGAVGDTPWSFVTVLYSEISLIFGENIRCSESEVT